MTLYIYRVGWTYPTINPVYRSKSIKISSCTRTLPGPVRPVGLTGQTSRPLPDRPQCLDRSYRSDRLVPILAVNIGPLFFSKACLPKHILLSQNCLRAMINTTSAIFVLKAINNYRSCFAQVDVETTCLGRHTFFTVADVFGTASTCCSIDFFFAQTLQPLLLSKRQA